MTALLEEARWRGGEGAAAPAGGVLEGWRGFLAYAAAVLTPLIGFVGNLGLAPLVALLGIGALPFLAARRKPDPGFALLLGILLLALLSMIWSVGTPLHPDFRRYKEVEGLIGLKLVFELALYGAFAVAMRALDPGVCARAGFVLSLGLAAVAVALVLEALDGAAVYTLLRGVIHQKPRADIAYRDAARGCYVAAVLFWPAALTLSASRWPVLAGVLTLGLLGAALLFRIDAAVLALAASAAVYVVVRRAGAPAIALLGCACLLYLTMAPLLAHLLAPALSPTAVVGSVAKQSWGERLEIWRFTSGEIVQNPIRGFGLDASRAFAPEIPVHPHDAALQLWLELGAPGVALTALLLVWFSARLMAVADRGLAAAGAASLCAYVVIGALSFGVWQEWWLALATLACVFWGFLRHARRLAFEDEGTSLAALPTIG